MPSGKSTPFIRGGVALSLPMGIYGGAGWEFAVGKHRLQLSATAGYQGIIVTGHMVTCMIDVAIVL